MRITVTGGNGAWPEPGHAAGRVHRLVLTHLWPGSDPAEAVAAARRSFTGRLDVAAPGLVLR